MGHHDKPLHWKIHIPYLLSNSPTPPYDSSKFPFSYFERPINATYKSLVQKIATVFSESVIHGMKSGSFAHCIIDDKHITLEAQSTEFMPVQIENKENLIKEIVAQAKTAINIK